MSFCECGCGKETKVGKRFCWGHNSCKKNSFHESLQKKNLCDCGCNQEIENPEYNYRLNQYQKYIRGHNNIKNNPGFKTGFTPWNKGNNGEYMKGENNPFFGKHHTEENNQKNRDVHLGNFHDDNYKNLMSKRMSGKNNPSYGKITKSWSRGSYYDSSIQGKIYLRSSYELKFAQYLDKNNISWLYEIQTFNLGNTTYTPDFYLPTCNMFIEIKGYMTDKAQEKINKFLDNYNDETLQILRKEDLIKLGCKL